MPDGLAMPLVSHLPLRDASSVLAGAGIRYRIERAQSRSVPDGALITVAPVPGTVMGPGAEAVLTVSSGPPVSPPS